MLIRTLILRGLTLALAAGLACADASAQDAVLLQRRAAARSALVERLEDFASWCNANKLYLDRNRAFGIILRFDPEHARAHRGLGHRRTRQEWREPAEPLVVENFAGPALSELDAHWERVMGDFDDATLALLESPASVLPRAQREELLADVLSVDPDNPLVHAACGEVEHGSRWVLGETLQAKERRRVLKQLVRASLERVPDPKQLEPTPSERGLGVPWKHVLATRSVRVLCSGELAEAVRAVQVAHAMGSFFRAVFGVEHELPGDYRVYHLADTGQKESFLGNHSAIEPDAREFLGRLVGTGIPGSWDVAQWDEKVTRRLDGTARHTLASHLRLAYGIDVRHGWVWEGFGLFLTRHLIGTRLTWFISPDSKGYLVDESSSLEVKLQASDANWMNLGYRMLREGRAPRLGILLGHDVNAMSPEDLLYSYVLAAYLIEGRTEETPEILRRVGAGEPSATVLEETLDLSLGQLEKRLLRWLSERR